jgi:hypothetical protein
LDKIVLDMNNYSSLRNLSVVAHNQMLVPRTNAKTEKARLLALDLLLVEMGARNDYALGLPLATKNLQKASAKTNKALQAFFKAKDKDDTLEPLFKVVPLG